MAKKFEYCAEDISILSGERLYGLKFLASSDKKAPEAFRKLFPLFRDQTIYRVIGINKIKIKPCTK